MLRKIIRQIISESFNLKNRTIANSERLIELFSNQLDEDNNEMTKEVLDKISSNDWEKQNAQSYYNAINLSKHKEMLEDYSVNEFSKMKLFKLNGYNIGYALKKRENGKYSEIVAVFNNEQNIKGIGKELIKSAIKNGGCYLDHFDGFLTTIYEPLGFVEYKRDSFDPQYDEDGSFRKKYGEADIIYRVHKNCI
jgi:hypothetical protein